MALTVSTTLPLCSPEAVPISNICFVILISVDTHTHLTNLVPFDSYAAEVRVAMLLRIGRLAVVRLANLLLTLSRRCCWRESREIHVVPNVDVPVR